MKTRSKVIITIFIFGLLFGLMQSPSWAKSFFAGKTIRVMCGYKPGGGYDMHARLMALHIVKYIPGKPKAVVMNMLGVNRLPNYFQHEAKRDGLTIAVMTRGAIFSQALDMGKKYGVNFDVTQFNWLGSASFASQVIIVRSALGIKTFEDLRTLPKPLRLTYGDIGGVDIRQLAIIALPLLGANVEHYALPGGSSTAAIVLAMDRGEIPLLSLDFDSMNNIRPEWLKDGFVNMIARIGQPYPDPRVEKLPSYTELAITPTGKKISEFIEEMATAGRPFAAPPGVPADRVKVLREAFAKTLKDPEYLAKAKKMKIQIFYVNGDNLQKMIKKGLELDPAVRKEFKKTVFKAWGWEK